MTETRNECKELNDSSGSTPCPKCGDAWKWPHTDKCYSCEEERLYALDELEKLLAESKPLSEITSANNHEYNAIT